MDDSKDIEFVLNKRHDNGADYWATEDGRLAVGSPFSTIESLQILHELGVTADHEAARGALDLLLESWRENGRYRLAPSGTHHPCLTANSARVLCRFGLVEDERVQTSLSTLLEEQHTDGGWRCKTVALGKSPVTDASNPGVTMFALDAFRFSDHLNANPGLDRAVDSLLDHWDVRRPLGPCQFGIGTLFMQVEYPFLRYNIFSYVYVLSFYQRAREDERFREALEILAGKVDEEGRMIVERPNRKLSKLSAFSKGKPSQPATDRYREILANVS